jgi:hypothetical protein
MRRKEEPMQNVLLRFRRPSGAGQHQPSLALTDALQRLSQCPEMQPLLTQARTAGKSIAVELFQTRDGQPILIHFAKVNA